MNKVKEKKLNAIKSEISQIKDFVLSNNANNKNQTSSVNGLRDEIDDTITLTKIVDYEKNSPNLRVLSTIREDLDLLKSKLIKHDEILKEILLKIK